MNRLFIEVNNHKIKATIVTGGNNWSILMSETYERKTLWEKQLKQDIKNIDESIIDYSLLINVPNNKIKTKRYKKQLIQVDDESMKREKFRIKNELMKEYDNHSIQKIRLIASEVNPSAREMICFYEMTHKSDVKDVTSRMLREGFNKPKILSTFKSIEESLSSFKQRMVTSIHIDDEQIILTSMHNGKIINIDKYSKGLNMIYEKLSRTKKIPYEKGVRLFKNYGNIPPEDVKDNRIIHSDIAPDGSMIKLDKKELSQEITTFVDGLLSELSKKMIFKDEKFEHKMVLSGDIVRLNGVKKYISRKLDLMDSEIYESQKFGFSSINTMITEGTINQIKIKEEEKLQEKNLKQKIQEIITRKERIIGK